MNTNAPTSSPPSAPPAARRFLVRVAWLALVWLGLNGLDAKSWIIGGPVVLLAAGISLKLLPELPWHWTLPGLAGFIGFFLRESLRGGWEVSLRALSPKLSLSPAMIVFPMKLPAGPARLFFCSAISLLPGTAVVAIENEMQNLRIHVLDASPRVEPELRDLERRVAALFGLALPVPEVRP